MKDRIWCVAVQTPSGNKVPRPGGRSGKYKWITSKGFAFFMHPHVPGVTDVFRSMYDKRITPHPRHHRRVWRFLG